MFEGKILDGKNRYHACKLVNITPCFVHLFKDLDPYEYVDAKNLDRRQLSPAQRADRGLNRLEREEKKANDRKLSQLIQNKNSTVPTSKVVSVARGESIVIIAKRCKTSKDSIRTARNVRKLNDPEINELWRQARMEKISIKNVEEHIKKRIHPTTSNKNLKKTKRPFQKSRKKKNLETSDFEKAEKVIKAAEKYPLIGEQWNEVKEGKRTLEEVVKNIDKVIQVDTKISKRNVNNLKKAGKSLSKKKGVSNQTSNSKPIVEDKTTSIRHIDPECKNSEFCHNPNDCSEAHLSVRICDQCDTGIYKCTQCGKAIYSVKCEADPIKKDIKQRTPIFSKP